MPDEKNPGRLRHVTRNEIVVRYKVCLNYVGMLSMYYGIQLAT